MNNLAVSIHGLPLKKARITLTSPLGLYMDFSASEPNASKLIAFGQKCIEELEQEAASKLPMGWEYESSVPDATTIQQSQ